MKVDRNKLVGALHGKIGGMVFLVLNGEPIARAAPNRKAPRTAPELAQNDRMARAAAYGNSLKTDPAKQAFYAALPHKPGIGPYHLAVRDYHHPPVVEDIDVSGYGGRIGDAIRILATDDSGVLEVQVEVRDMQGTGLEAGLARLDPTSGRWVYVSTRDIPSGQAVTIQATAKDRPGNTASKSTLGYAR